MQIHSILRTGERFDVMAEQDFFKAPLKAKDEDGNEIWTQGSS